MKTTNTLKMNKLTKSEYHADIMPAFVAYRKQMHKKCGVETDDYLELFTERRVRGARTKYWYSKKSLPAVEIATYIGKNPYFTANGKTYRVTAKWAANNPYYGFRNYAIFCEIVK